jgi:hypothetical protein
MSLLSGRWTLGYNHSSYLGTFRTAASLDVAGRYCRIRPERTSLLEAYALVETDCLFLADTRFQAQDELACCLALDSGSRAFATPRPARHWLCIHPLDLGVIVEYRDTGTTRREAVQPRHKRRALDSNSCSIGSPCC